MRLLITHGRSLAFAIPTTMQCAWEDALRDGLRRVEATYSRDIPVSFAFYGDLWRRDTPGSPTADDEKERDAAPVSGIAEEEELAPLQIAVTSELLAESDGEFVDERERLDWRNLTELAATLDARFGVGTVVLTHFLKDLAGYFADPALRQRTMDIVERAIREEGDQVVLLAHSMGSIVGYDLLMRIPDLPVRAFITFGSPLGLPSFLKQVRNTDGATPFPPQLPRWINIYNREDFATAVHHLAPLFPSGDRRSIEDAEAIGRPPGLLDPIAGHDAVTYLSSITMGQSVRAVVEKATSP